MPRFMESFVIPTSSLNVSKPVQQSNDVYNSELTEKNAYVSALYSS